VCRFIRTEALIGKQGLATLASATVAVFGLGGVGSYCAQALARAGVGHLVLVDHDIVDISNINRQCIAFEHTVGKPKADVMAGMIAGINPDCRAEPVMACYTETTSAKLLRQNYDYVADCIDSVKAKVDLIKSCVSRGVKVISCMGTGNKLDPGQFRVADISQTHTCPLARIIRRQLRKEGISAGLPVVFSAEKPVAPLIPDETPASISFVPPVAGFLMAGFIVRRLLSEDSASSPSTPGPPLSISFQDKP